MYIGKAPRVWFTSLAYLKHYFQYRFDGHIKDYVLQKEDIYIPDYIVEDGPFQFDDKNLFQVLPKENF